MANSKREENQKFGEYRGWMGSLREGTKGQRKSGKGAVRDEIKEKKLWEKEKMKDGKGEKVKK